MCGRRAIERIEWLTVARWEGVRRNFSLLFGWTAVFGRRSCKRERPERLHLGSEGVGLGVEVAVLRLGGDGARRVNA